MICLMCGKDEIITEKLFSLFLMSKNQEELCKDCRDGFEVISDKHCPSCYKQGFVKRCPDCILWEKQGYQVSHEALYRYNDAMKSYFSAYKFQGDYLLSKIFANEFRKALKKYKDYTILPVPISPDSLAKRQFNQVTAFLEAAKVKYMDLLEKENSSVKQSEKKRQERLQSQGTFYIKQGVNLPHKVLIVDDIYTTGATIKNIYDLLREHEITDIRSFSLSR